MSDLEYQNEQTYFLTFCYEGRKITLYHGSLEVVEKPAILEPNHTMELRAFKLADQLLFHSPKALEFLRFEKSEVVSKRIEK